jgi:hypothetical protein
MFLLLMLELFGCLLAALFYSGFFFISIAVAAKVYAELAGLAVALD